MLIFSRYSWWVGAMVGLALLTAVLSQTGLLNPIQGVVLRITNPIERAATGFFRPIATLLSDAGSLNELQDENRRLRLENEQFQVQIADLERQTERLKELEEALKIPAAAGNVLVPANIVHRNSTPFTDTISIDQGSNKGIKSGMVVLSAQGTLIGTVTATTATRAFIRLVTDASSRVASQVLETKVIGSVEGAAERKLAFKFAESGDDIAVGDTIVTSGLGGNYPSGVLIGRVSAISGTPQDLFRNVLVEPTVRLSTAQTVLVNTSFIPERIGLEKP